MNMNMNLTQRCTCQVVTTEYFVYNKTGFTIVVVIQFNSNVTRFCFNIRFRLQYTVKILKLKTTKTATINIAGLTAGKINCSAGVGGYIILGHRRCVGSGQSTATIYIISNVTTADVNLNALLYRTHLAAAKYITCNLGIIVCDIQFCPD